MPRFIQYSWIIVHSRTDAPGNGDRLGQRLRMDGQSVEAWKSCICVHLVAALEQVVASGLPVCGHGVVLFALLWQSGRVPRPWRLCITSSCIIHLSECCGFSSCDRSICHGDTLSSSIAAGNAPIRASSPSICVGDWGWGIWRGYAVGIDSPFPWILLGLFVMTDWRDWVGFWADCMALVQGHSGAMFWLSLLVAVGVWRLLTKCWKTLWGWPLDCYGGICLGFSQSGGFCGGQGNGVAFGTLAELERFKFDCAVGCSVESIMTSCCWASCIRSIIGRLGLNEYWSCDMRFSSKSCGVCWEVCGIGNWDGDKCIGMSDEVKDHHLPWSIAYHGVHRLLGCYVKSNDWLCTGFCFFVFTNYLFL